MEQNSIPIAQQVKAYIQRKPFIIEAIERDIVNYSALAREISDELDIKSTETVKAALIRASSKHRGNKQKREQKAIKLLRKARFSIKNKIAALHHSTFVDVPAIAYSKTPSGYMFFLGEEAARDTRFKKIDYGLAIIHIKSKKEIEHTPGAIAFILQALASEGINISHVMGCREDTFIVVKEPDAPLAFETLAQRLRL